MHMQGNGLAQPVQRPSVGTCGAPATAGDDDSAGPDDSSPPGSLHAAAAIQDDEVDAEAEEAWEDANLHAGLAYDANDAGAADGVGTDTYHLTLDPGGGEEPFA